MGMLGTGGVFPQALWQGGGNSASASSLQLSIFCRGGCGPCFIHDPSNPGAAGVPSSVGKGYRSIGIPT